MSCVRARQGGVGAGAQCANRCVGQPMVLEELGEVEEGLVAGPVKVMLTQESGRRWTKKKQK